MSGAYSLCTYYSLYPLLEDSACITRRYTNDLLCSIMFIYIYFIFSLASLHHEVCIRQIICRVVCH